MAVTSTPIYPQTVNVGVNTIAPADTQTYKTVATGGTNGTKIESLILSSTDTSARDVTINITRSAVNYQLAVISVPITAGTVDTVPSVDVLRNSMIPGLAYDSNGNKYLYLKSGDTLTINAPVTITTAKQITAVASGGDF